MSRERSARDRFLPALLVAILLTRFLPIWAPVFAAIAFVQKANSNTSAVTITGVASGDFLVWSGSSGNPVTALTDGAGDTWTEVPNSQNQSGINQACSQWYDANASSGSHTVTRTGGFGSFESYSIGEYSGIATVSPLDKDTSAVGSTGAPSSGATATTTQANEVAIGTICNDSNQNNSAWLNSFTQRDFINSTGGGSRPTNWADLIVSSTGAYTAATSGVLTQNWQALIATFKQASGGGTPGCKNGLVLLGAGCHD
jgi:hypothetical protein